jgi:hypothetical protein
MPRWVGALFLVLCGIVTIYGTVGHTVFFVRDYPKPLRLPIWLGKLFNYTVAGLCFAGAILIWMSGPK